MTIAVPAQFYGRCATALVAVKHTASAKRAVEPLAATSVPSGVRGGVPGDTAPRSRWAHVTAPRNQRMDGLLSQGRGAAAGGPRPIRQ
eukprot:COSAG05_NODE_1708_length_4240_cov_2505.441439_2_plen_88_part_00